MSLLAGALWLDGATGITHTPAPDPLAPERCGHHVEGPAFFTWRLPALTPESRDEVLPTVSADRRWVVTYSGRIDNRDDLMARYGVRADASDGEPASTAPASRS